MCLVNFVDHVQHVLDGLAGYVPSKCKVPLRYRMTIVPNLVFREEYLAVVGDFGHLDSCLTKNESASLYSITRISKAPVAWTGLMR